MRTKTKKYDGASKGAGFSYRSTCLMSISNIIILLNSADTKDELRITGESICVIVCHTMTLSLLL